MFTKTTTLCVGSFSYPPKQNCAGGLIQDRFWKAEVGHRFGLNGMEKDDEVSGTGNQYDYGFRVYNPRIGKFLSMDPLFRSFPWYTPYQFAGNKPIVVKDLDGLEENIVIRWYENGVYMGTTVTYLRDKRRFRLYPPEHLIYNDILVLDCEYSERQYNLFHVHSIYRGAFNSKGKFEYVGLSNAARDVIINASASTWRKTFTNQSEQEVGEYNKKVNTTISGVKDNNEYLAFSDKVLEIHDDFEDTDPFVFAEGLVEGYIDILIANP